MKPTLWGLVAWGLACGIGTLGCSQHTHKTVKPPTPSVSLHRLKMPDGQRDLPQVSDLQFGQLGRRKGLWLIADRNSQYGGNRIYFIEQTHLAQLTDQQNAVADASFVITAPTEGWDAFMAAHPHMDATVLASIRHQINGMNTATAMLDLEALTIGGNLTHEPAAASCTEPSFLYVVAETPHNVILQLRIDDEGAEPRAVLVNCFQYQEDSQERGSDHNDGIEGLAWSASARMFYVAEEGTRPNRPDDSRHFFDVPRLSRGSANGDAFLPDPAWSNTATESVRAVRGTPSQTLNALSFASPHQLLAVDRNGGWILRIDIATGGAERWLGIYDPQLLNLRERLAQFPAERRMPYVSIEGIALDEQETLWLVDDPAMPEATHASSLIGLHHPPTSAQSPANR